MAPSAPTKILVYLLRRDLRLIDNPVFLEIQRAFQKESSPFTHLLPIYVFPSHQVEVSGFIPEGKDADSKPKSPYPEARSQVAGFWRCGPHRAKFLAESVWDLKTTLEEKGSRLVIRAGKITDVLRDVFRHVEESNKSSGETSSSSTFSSSSSAAAAAAERQVVGVWMTKDDGHEEKREEEAIRELVEGSGRKFRLIEDDKFYVHE